MKNGKKFLIGLFAVGAMSAPVVLSTAATATDAGAHVSPHGGFKGMG